MLMGQRGKVKKELKEFHQSLKNERRWTTVEKNKDRLDGINVLVFGPPNTPYEGGTFDIEISFPPTYPLKAPKMVMKTPIFHPMINKQGDIRLAILGNWDSKKKGHKFINCLENIYDALENPQNYLAEAINDDATALFNDDRKQFKAKAREYTQKYSMLKYKVSDICVLFSFCFFFFFFCFCFFFFLFVETRLIL